LNNKEIKSWEDLEVLQKSHQLVLEIYKITKEYPSNEKYRLIDQLCRASTSIPTNIAEGRVKGEEQLRNIFNF